MNEKIRLYLVTCSLIAFLVFLSFLGVMGKDIEIFKGRSWPALEHGMTRQEVIDLLGSDFSRTICCLEEHWEFPPPGGSIFGSMNPRYWFFGENNPNAYIMFFDEQDRLGPWYGVGGDGRFLEPVDDGNAEKPPGVERTL